MALDLDGPRLSLIVVGVVDMEDGADDVCIDAVSVEPQARPAPVPGKGRVVRKERWRDGERDRDRERERESEGGRDSG